MNRSGARERGIIGISMSVNLHSFSVIHKAIPLGNRSFSRKVGSSNNPGAPACRCVHSDHRTHLDTLDKPGVSSEVLFLIGCEFQPTNTKEIPCQTFNINKNKNWQTENALKFI